MLMRKLFALAKLLVFT